MSTVKVNSAQIGQSGTAAQNFTLTAAQADGTIKLSRGVPGATTQDVLTVGTDGVVTLPVGLAITNFTQFTGTNQSLSANGYQKLPGGLIIQWGKLTNIDFGSGSAQTLTFPIAFPNTCLSLTCTMDSSGGGTNPNAFVSIGSKTTTGATLYYYEYTGTVQSSGATWIAIGF